MSEPPSPPLPAPAPTGRRGALFASAAILLLVALDQAAKLLVRRSFAPGESLPVVPGLFNLTYVRNIGAAWGILAGWRIVLVGLAIAMFLFLALRRRQVFGSGRLATASFILLLAGIAGNVIDRVFLGYVVDFLDFHHGAWHFPSFNVADSCICVGVGLFLLRHFLFPDPQPPAGKTSGD